MASNFRFARDTLGNASAADRMYDSALHGQVLVEELEEPRRVFNLNNSAIISNRGTNDWELCPKEVATMSILKLGNVDLRAVASCERDGGVPLHAAVQRITDIETARDYIAHIDFTLLKEKLMLSAEEGGHGWSVDMANKAEAKYKKWLFLKLKYENVLIPPPNDIDTFWHYHILDSQAYMRDTAAIFGQYVHHYPYFGMRGKADAQKLREAFENTKRIYREEYGEDVTE
jgi:hypothetical protein